MIWICISCDVVLCEMMMYDDIYVYIYIHIYIYVCCIDRQFRGLAFGVVSTGIVTISSWSDGGSIGGTDGWMDGCACDGCDVCDCRMCM